MPKYVRPYESDDLEDPIQALGNMLRARIIGDLRQHGPSKRGEITKRLDVGYQAVGKALQVLVRAGVVLTDPAHPTKGQQVRYRVDQEAVSEMWIQLGQAIGEL